MYNRMQTATLCFKTTQKLKHSQHARQSYPGSPSHTLSVRNETNLWIQIIDQPF
jgi:hypothetical protein